MMRKNEIYGENLNSKREEDYAETDQENLAIVRTEIDKLLLLVNAPDEKFDRGPRTTLINYLDPLIKKSQLTENELKQITKLIEYLGKE